MRTKPRKPKPDLACRVPRRPARDRRERAGHATWARLRERLDSGTLARPTPVDRNSPEAILARLRRFHAPRVNYGQARRRERFWNEPAV